MKTLKQLAEDLLPGGKGDNNTIEDLVKKHNLPLEYLQNQLQVGIAVEKEHTNNADEAHEIAMDHLTEDGKYYSKLIQSGIVDELEALQLYKDLQLYKPPMVAEIAKLKQLVEFMAKTKIHKLTHQISEITTPKKSSSILLRSLLEGVQTRPIYEIAQEIKRDWKNVYYAAKPYLSAMMELDKITDRYYDDSAKSVVLYFLSNASQWKGDKAKEIKLELNKMVK